MARNAEKAMTALARWHKMKVDEERGPIQKRPGLTSECKDVKQAEKWRSQVIREIAKKIAQIQNPGLGEFKIRDVNDEINKLLRVKYHWELRIKELGGPDYKRIAPKMLDRSGREVPGNRGYKYFGAAKDLPGVRELFEIPAQESGKKNRTELARFIDADYYGYMEDEDGVLIPQELAEERKVVAQALEEWDLKHREEIGEQQPSISAVDPEDLGIYRETAAGDEIDEYFSHFPDLHVGPLLKAEKMDAYDEGGEEGPKFISHVEVPSQKDVEQALLMRKKRELLEKYAGEVLQQQNEEAMVLLGYTNEPESSSRR